MKILGVLPPVVVFISAHAQLCAQPGSPSILEQPEEATTNVGGAAGFRVTATGSLPLSYQWFQDGRSVPGATQAALALGPVTATQAGRYHVRVENATGAAESAAVKLTVEPPPAVPVVESTFEIDPAVIGSIGPLLPLADGSAIIGSNKQDSKTIDASAAEVMRLRPDGKIDPSFARGTAMVGEFDPRPLFYAPTIAQFDPLPDGRIVVTGRFASYSGFAAPGIVRLQADGTVDRSFVVSPEVLNPANRTDSEFLGSYIPKAAVQPNGKVVIVDMEARLVRVLANGQRDDSFKAPWSHDTTAVAASAEGRVFAGIWSEPIQDGGARVVALLDDGGADPAFGVYGCNAIRRLYATRDGGVWVSTESLPVAVAPAYSRVRYSHIFRLRADGSLDPIFGLRAGVPMTAPAPDGRFLLGDGTMIGADGVTETKPNLGAGLGQRGGYVFGADGRLWVTFAPRSVARLNVDGTEHVTLPRIVAAWADRASVRVGESVSLHVAAVAPGPVAYYWSSVSANIPIQTSEPHYTFTPNSPWQNGEFPVRVTNSAGSATSSSVMVRIEPAELRIVSQPQVVVLTPDRFTPAFFSGWGVELAPGAAVVREEWRRDGVLFGWPYLSTAASAVGTYTVTFTDTLGHTVTSAPIVVTVREVSRLSNLSTRAEVGAGSHAAILGFTIPHGVRTVLVRGIGPALVSAGVTNALPASRLELFDERGGLLFRANSWERSNLWGAARIFNEVGAFPLPAGSADAALEMTLPAGNYTARLSGIGESTGVGLIELYEHDMSADRFTNISSRVWIEPRDDAAGIAGFVIQGVPPKRVLVRVAGPALRALGVEGALTNPRLEVHDASGRTIAANDDWQTAADGAAIAQAAMSVGAFPFLPQSQDAAVVVELAPGNYTAVAVSAGHLAGAGLIEIYELP